MAVLRRSAVTVTARPGPPLPTMSLVPLGISERSID